MSIIKHIVFVAMSSIVLTGYAKEKETPTAEIKVGYRYHEKFLRGNVQFTERDISMVLLANSEGSKFYSPDTEYKDSLESTPSGRAQAKQVLNAAIKKYAESKDESVMNAIVYKTFMYVFKDYGKAEMTVYDKAGMVERGVYDEPFGEPGWQIGDSTKTVLGYECIKATTDFHGRQWTAWFAPEIPLHDGPWKLQGLPGLILEAYEEKDHHHFTAEGIENTTAAMYPIYNPDGYDRMNRIDLLKSRRNSLDNNNSIAKASIGLDLGTDAPSQTEYDFLETDYR